MLLRRKVLFLAPAQPILCPSFHKILSSQLSLACWYHSIVSSTITVHSCLYHGIGIVPDYAVKEKVEVFRVSGWEFFLGKFKV